MNKWYLSGNLALIPLDIAKGTVRSSDKSLGVEERDMLTEISRRCKRLPQSLHHSSVNEFLQTQQEHKQEREDNTHDSNGITEFY